MMASTRVDSINIKAWLLSIICASITFINVTVQTVAVHFPNLGFPCAYYEINDLSAVNLTAMNDITKLNPQLFLNPVQLISYVVFMDVVFFCILLYYIYCCASVWVSDRKTRTLNQSTRDILWLGDTLSCFEFILAMDTFQLFVMCLSFRLAMVAAFTYCIFFICFTAFTVTLLTQYQSFEKSSFNLSKLHPALRGTVKYKTALVNVVEVALGFSITVFALTMCLGLGNSFFVRAAYVAFGAINTFLVLSIIYLLIMELILYRYVKIQFGLHAGILFGLCGIIYPIIKYETSFASAWTTDIWINIAVIALVWLGFTLCRIIRFFLHRQKRYKLLSPTITDELNPLDDTEDMSP